LKVNTKMLYSKNLFYEDNYTFNMNRPHGKLNGYIPMEALNNEKTDHTQFSDKIQLAIAARREENRNLNCEECEPEE